MRPVFLGLAESLVGIYRRFVVEAPGGQWLKDNASCVATVRADKGPELAFPPVAGRVGQRPIDDWVKMWCCCASWGLC